MSDPTPSFWLARMLQRIDSPAGAKRIYHVLLAVCGMLVVIGWLLPHHETHGGAAGLAASIPSFYGIYGFVMCALLVLVAKALRRLLIRPEDYYAPRSIDSEEAHSDIEEEKP